MFRKKLFSEIVRIPQVSSPMFVPNAWENKDYRERRFSETLIFSIFCETGSPQIVEKIKSFKKVIFLESLYFLGVRHPRFSQSIEKQTFWWNTIFATCSNTHENKWFGTATTRNYYRNRVNINIATRKRLKTQPFINILSLPNQGTLGKLILSEKFTLPY